MSHKILNQHNNVPSTSDNDSNSTTAQTQSEFPSSTNQSLKLLSPHVLIYNALNNPDLEMLPSPRSAALSRFPTRELRDPKGPQKENIYHPKASNASPTTNVAQMSNVAISPDIGKGMFEESWQCLSSESFRLIRPLSASPFAAENARPSSLLSITSDEDPDVADDTQESLVIVSNQHSAMVFETDEEDEGRDTSLIMPRVSLNMLQEPKSNIMTITLLSSCELRCQHETNELIKTMQTELGPNINMIHLSLQTNDSSHLNEEIIRNSNLIFIFNDGLFVFVDYLNQIFKQLSQLVEVSEFDDYENDLLPKLTVINMLTVNYFINLFELISQLKPYQIWKTPSLSHNKLLKQFKDFIGTELSNSGYCTTLSKEMKKDLKLKFDMERSTSMYSSLTPTHASNYKTLEKKFKAELVETSSLVDPLQLNWKKVPCFNAIYKLIKNLTASLESSSAYSSVNLYVITSFAVGVSLGIGITSGVARLVTLYVADHVYALTEVVQPEMVKETPIDHSVLAKFSNLVFEMREVLESVSRIVSNFLDSLKQGSSFMVGLANGGLNKLMAFVF